MTPAAANSKLLLVAAPGVVSSQPGFAPVRRYRLARVRFDGPSGVSDPGASSASGASDEVGQRFAQ